MLSPNPGIRRWLFCCSLSPRCLLYTELSSFHRCMRINWCVVLPLSTLLLLKAFFQRFFPKTLSSAMGLGFMGSFGLGMGWKSWSFQAIGLFLSSYVLMFYLLDQGTVSLLLVPCLQSWSRRSRLPLVWCPCICAYIFLVLLL